MNPAPQLKAQIVGVAVAASWSAALTFALARLLGLVLPLRVSAEDEYDGLDLAAHGERAYDHG
jgi:Amt family ammonium transporter